jgi:hypothetical protein
LNGALVVGAVEFVGNGGQPIQTGDVNADGEITAADYIILADNQHTDLSALSLAEAYRRGDLNEDLANNHADFVSFKTAFEEANGAGSFAAMLAGIPEPSSLAIVILAGMIGFATSARRGR